MTEKYGRLIDDLTNEGKGSSNMMQSIRRVTEALGELIRPSTSEGTFPYIIFLDAFLE